MTSHYETVAATGPRMAGRDGQASYRVGDGDPVPVGDSRLMSGPVRSTRRLAPLVMGLAALSLLAACHGSVTRSSEGSGPFTTVADATTTVPAPTTTLPAPTTTTAPQATPAQSTSVRVCSQPSVPPGVVATELATPNVPNLTYAASPGGPIVGVVANPWGGPSSRPVVDQQNGWVEIRLYTRPNGSMGWVRSQDVTFSTTSYRIVVSICQRTLTIFQGGIPVYSSLVGVGQPRWPTPLGSTFVDAIVATPHSELSVYGPTVIMLGTHSNVFTDFDGGDGVVAIHGYPSDPASTRGVASSHGCVRSSPATVDVVKTVPVGTPVDLIA
jgi:hypothetical protein